MTHKIPAYLHNDLLIAHLKLHKLLEPLLQLSPTSDPWTISGPRENIRDPQRNLDMICTPKKVCRPSLYTKQRWRPTRFHNPQHKKGWSHTVM